MAFIIYHLAFNQETPKMQDARYLGARNPARERLPFLFSEKYATLFVIVMLA